MLACNTLDVATATPSRVSAPRAAPGVRSFHDFRTRGGKVPHVDVHVVVHPAMTAQALHDLHLHVLAEARRIVGPSTRVLLHADPEGDEDHAGDDIGGVDV